MELKINKPIDNNVKVMQKVKLKHIIKISKGKKSNEVNFSNLRYIQIGDLRNDNNLKYAEHRKSNVLCTKNDILIAWDGANAGTIGYNLEGAIGSTLAKLVINDNYKIFPIFLGRFLQTKSKSLRDNCSGATIPHISKSELENIEIPLPNITTQQKIANILDKADELRQYNKQLVEKYDALTQSLFLDMFGDPVKNEKVWELKKLRAGIKNLQSGLSLSGEERLVENDEIAVLKISAVTSGFFKNTEHKVVNKSDITKPLIFPKKGDLLFSRANTKEKVGAVAVVDKDYSNLFLPDKLWRIDTNDFLNNLFLKNILSHQGFRYNIEKVATGTSGSMLNISMQKFYNIEAPFPPISIQNQFAERVQIIENQKQQAQEALEKSEALFQSLLQKAFKGELN